jgi:hypothetical protein
MRAFGVLELIRTGRVALPRTAARNGATVARAAGATTAPHPPRAA